MSRGGRPPSLHLLRVSPHAGIWRLTHNGVFCSDHATEADATAAAHAAAGEQTAIGHAVQVLTPGQGPALAVAASPDE
jgi:hypothetical protein